MTQEYSPMPSDKIRKRLTGIFSDIDKLVADPKLDEKMRNELETIRARIAEFKEQAPDPEPRSITKKKQSTQNQKESQPAILYEKEHIGYAFTGNNLEPTHRSKQTIPDTAKGLKVPLTETGIPIGEVFVEAPPDRDLSNDDAQLAEAIAQQVSIQIQNLRLLSAAERARAEAQAATRQFTHQSWENFMDAIHQREQIGFAYDQSEVSPYDEVTPSNADFEATVSVLDQQVGRLFLQSDPDKPLTQEDKELANAVARQVAQQVENLRLLADASRARTEADNTIRMLSRENWQVFAKERDESLLGFVYDSNQVLSIAESAPVQDINYVESIKVQGEDIGQLAIAGAEAISDEQKEFLATVADRMGIHLETLRLNEELRQRAFELQELDRLKSSFLANMSHELRTPLNAILGFSDVMLEGIDGPLTDYMENDLKLIQKNGQHLLHLINDVLDMAKIESGRLALHPETFSLNELFEDVFSITSSLANEKSLILAVADDSVKDVEILADITRIRQVMINVVNNAIKFTEKGGITVRSVMKDKETVLISIIDTGLGIPQDHLESIFQEFSQVDSSTTRKVGGTGLGLPISRKLIEMHGGHMWAESEGEIGNGSTIFIELPLEAKITQPT